MRDVKTWDLPWHINMGNRESHTWLQSECRQYQFLCSLSQTSAIFRDYVTSNCTVFHIHHVGKNIDTWFDQQKYSITTNLDVNLPTPLTKHTNASNPDRHRRRLHLLLFLRWTSARPIQWKCVADLAHSNQWMHIAGDYPTSYSFWFTLDRNLCWRCKSFS